MPSRRPAICSARTRTVPARRRACSPRRSIPTKLVQTTATPRLDLLAADASLRGLDHFLHDLDKKKRLLKLIERLGQDYDRIILDAPPGLTDTSEQVLRAADLILVPLIPSPLSQRAFDEVLTYLDRNQIRHGPVLPVYNMVDRRRSLHLAALAAHADWPVVPMASAFEAMSASPDGVGRLRAGSPPRSRRDGAVARDRKAARPLRLMKNLDPDLLLRAYAIGVFPMSDSRDAHEVYWVEPRRAGDHPARRLPSLEVAAQDAAVGSVSRSRCDARLRRGRAALRGRARIPGSTPRSRPATSACTRPGHAHSIEVWQDGELVGGLYGVRLGAAFFGEIMFVAEARRLEGRARLAGRAADRRRLPPARLPVHDRSTSQQPRRGRDRPEGLSGAVGVGARRRLGRRGGGRLGAAGAAGAAGAGPVEFEALDRLLAGRRPAPASPPPGMGHRAALGPDVVDRVLDDVERPAFPCRASPRRRAGRSGAWDRARRAGRRRRSAAAPPRAPSSRRRAAAR